MREPLFTVAVGCKGIGKTYTSLQMVYIYALGDASRGVHPRKVLIFDVNNEFSQIKTISLKDVLRYSVHPKVDIRRVTIYKDDGTQMSVNEMQEALAHILSNFSNGMIWLEDINRYVSDSLPNDLIGILATQRHIGCDVITHFQSKSKAGNPKIVGMMNVMRIHKTNDNFRKHRSKFEGHLQLLEIAEKLVENLNKKRDRNKQWAFCYANFDINGIQGDFSMEEFKQAVTDYILENESDTIKPMLNKKDRTGVKIYSYEQALSTLEEDLVHEYYANANAN
jgi:hypothetical protein